MNNEIACCLCIELSGSEMYSSQECEENPKKLESIKLELDNDEHTILRVKYRKTKPAILKVNLTKEALPQDRSYTALYKKCCLVAELNNGKPISVTFPWENSERYKYGQLIKF